MKIDFCCNVNDCNLIKSVLWWQVYDVTKFLDDHPGGDEVLLSATGAFPKTRATFMFYFAGLA